MLSKSPIKFKVKSSLVKDSQRSKFSIDSMLFIAKFKYSSSFSLFKFSIRDIWLACKYKIFSFLHLLFRSSILSMSSWCRDSSSKVPTIPTIYTHFYGSSDEFCDLPSLCSALFRINSSVICTIFYVAADVIFYSKWVKFLTSRVCLCSLIMFIVQVTGDKMLFTVEI